jgi:hypothetical protein
LDITALVAPTVMQPWHVAVPAPDTEGALRRIVADGLSGATSGGCPAITATEVDSGIPAHRPQKPVAKPRSVDAPEC